MESVELMYCYRPPKKTYYGIAIPFSETNQNFVYSISVYSTLL